MHKHPKVKAWLVPQPRWTFHFTPTSASRRACRPRLLQRSEQRPPGLCWLNAVEGCFAKLSRSKLQCGVFHAVVALQAAIKDFVEQHNQSPTPFVWRADPKHNIAAVKRGHQVLKTSHYVRTRRAGERVMTSVTGFVTRRLKLRGTRPRAQPPHGPGVPEPLGRLGVGEQDGIGTPAVDRPARRKFPVGSADIPSRGSARKRWRNGWNRFRQMSRRGMPRRLAAPTAGSPHGPPPRPAGRFRLANRMKGLLAFHGRIAASPALNMALSNAALATRGLPSMTPKAAQSNEPPWYGPVCPVVWEGGAARLIPIPI